MESQVFELKVQLLLGDPRRFCVYEAFAGVCDVSGDIVCVFG